MTRWIPWLLALLALVPLLGGAYALRLGTEIVAWSLAATALAFLYRTTGLVSLGHSAFFGGGAYVVALLTKGLGASVYPLAALLAVVLGFAFSLALGFLGLRSHGIFFLMLTLAFSQLLYILIKQGFPGLTGGDDGLAGIPRPPGLETPWVYYLAGIALLLGALLLYRAFVASPLGQVMDALRQNEVRVEVLGYDVRRLKLLASGLSGALAALGGAYLAGYRGFVHPHDLSWTTSGLLLVMAVVGGMRPVSAGVVGATLLIALEAFLSSYTDLWNLFLGVFLMAAAWTILRSRRATHVGA
ncbi:branched-chain amino acid ABC transporter permease [Thermus thermophilus]|uniref:Branched-chain amino acid ABC transporter permease n=1 Tax=Thermus thermophilus TaxID=274 RepID=A0A7R7TGE8_THETH|nr:branched-chain amino acid ABC transporter permease [Thermus thermophilus]BCP67619.1 branched-chain amino acid ABC transporter permease [Thermus thermophilus]